MRWIKKQSLDSSRVVTLQDELSVSETIAKLLVQRGIDSFDSAKNFFRPELSALHDPFEMQDMQVAVERVQKAIKFQETIMVYGDYDDQNSSRSYDTFATQLNYGSTGGVGMGMNGGGIQMAGIIKSPLIWIVN